VGVVQGRGDEGMGMTYKELQEHGTDLKRKKGGWEERIILVAVEPPTL